MQHAENHALKTYRRDVHSTGHHTKETKSHGHTHSPYKQLIIMGLIHFPLMYAVMFSMVYSMSEVLNNLNTFYMAGMMVAPMFVLMPVLMKSMYSNKKLNLVIYGTSVLIFLGFFLFTRSQAFIGDKQFLKSMIPHHSGAVLMCEKASISDPEIRNLCAQIIQNQRSEIAQMQKILERI